MVPVVSHLQANKTGPHKTVFWVTGEQYRGDWKDNKLHGKGIFTYKNGDKYEGDWQNGLRHGLGTFFVFKDNKYICRYHGEWAYDQPWVRSFYYLEVQRIHHLS